MASRSADIDGAGAAVARDGGACRVREGSGPRAERRALTMEAHASRIVGEVAWRVAEMIDCEVQELLGPGATFEQQQDAAAAISSDALWLREDLKLRSAVTTAEEVEIDGCRYRRLTQARQRAAHVAIRGRGERRPAIVARRAAKDVAWILSRDPVLLSDAHRLEPPATDVAPNRADVQPQLRGDLLDREHVHSCSIISSFHPCGA